MFATIVIISYGLFAFAVGYYFGWQAKKKDFQLMFRWECMEENCTFKMASDNPEMTLAFADAHMESKHKEKNDAGS